MVELRLAPRPSFGLTPQLGLMVVRYAARHLLKVEDRGREAEEKE